MSHKTIGDGVSEIVFIRIVLEILCPLIDMVRDGAFRKRSGLGVAWWPGLGLCIYLPFFWLAFVLLFGAGTRAGVANMHTAALFELAQDLLVSYAPQFASGGVNVCVCVCVLDGGLR